MAPRYRALHHSVDILSEIIWDLVAVSLGIDIHHGLHFANHAITLYVVGVFKSWIVEAVQIADELWHVEETLVESILIAEIVWIYEAFASLDPWR